MGKAVQPIVKFDVCALHVPHPAIAAEDWHGPLVIRLLGGKPYKDGEKAVHAQYTDRKLAAHVRDITLYWSGLREECKKRANTYQEPVLSEHAALGLACILVQNFAKLEITEVTQRGDRADYWLGDRELMLEVSGHASGALDGLLTEKRAQLLDNPYGKDGFVCAVLFSNLNAGLVFYRFPKGK